jgi:CRISPR-associated protein Cas5d
MAEISRPFSIRVRGDLACWTNPSLKAERVTYQIPTPSALRGLAESVLWKPAIHWRIEEIVLLAPIRYMQFRRNEVNSRASVTGANSCAKSNAPLTFYADEDRAQRNTVALRDVDFAFTARMEFTARRGPDDNLRKFEEMFERRLERGQWVTPPVLGLREFPASVVEPYTGDPAPIDLKEDFGWVLHDIHFGATQQATFFHAVSLHGRIAIPPPPPRAGVAS